MHLRDMTWPDLCGRVDRLLGDVQRSHWSYSWVDSLRAEFKRRCEAVGEVDILSPKLWDEIEKYAKAVGWGHKAVQRMRRELLKRRGRGFWVIGLDKGSGEPDYSAWTVASLQKDIGYALCPCPVVGKRMGDISPPGFAMVQCCKCLKFVTRPSSIPLSQPCPHCFETRPDTPSGYEFTGEWGLPGVRPYLSFDRLLVYAGEICHFRRDINGGKRWILRKVKEATWCCPRCKFEYSYEQAIRGSVCDACLADLTSRVEKLEEQHTEHRAGDMRWTTHKTPLTK